MAEPRTLDGISVLLVDDDPHSLDMYRFVLESAGATVESVPSALLAAEALERSCPQVLVSDIVMPEMTGLDLIGELRAREDACGQSHRDDGVLRRAVLERARAAGFDHAEPKPLSPQRLIDLVSGVVAKPRPG